MSLDFFFQIKNVITILMHRHNHYHHHFTACEVHIKSIITVIILFSNSYQCVYMSKSHVTSSSNTKYDMRENMNKIVVLKLKPSPVALVRVTGVKKLKDFPS